jgi:hypothetical protein
LLLGALLISADVAFIESQFHVLGDQWRLHLLLVAVLHGVTAYVYRSRVVLSLAITSLAGWINVNPRFGRPGDYAIGAYLMVVILMVWHELDRRFAKTEFARTLEHFAANFALLGSLMLIDRETTLGCLVTMVVAAMVIAWGFRSRNEWFVLYAFLYGVIALNILIITSMHLEALSFLLVLASIIGSIIALFRIHAKFKELQS